MYVCVYRMMVDCNAIQRVQCIIDMMSIGTGYYQQCFVFTFICKVIQFFYSFYIFIEKKRIILTKIEQL